MFFDKKLKEENESLKLQIKNLHKYVENLDEIVQRQDKEIEFLKGKQQLGWSQAVSKSFTSQHLDKLIESAEDRIYEDLCSFMRVEIADLFLQNKQLIRYARSTKNKNPYAMVSLAEGYAASKHEVYNVNIRIPEINSSFYIPAGFALDDHWVD